MDTFLYGLLSGYMVYYQVIWFTIRLYGLLLGYIDAICLYLIDYIKHIQNNRSLIDFIKTIKLL
jgi:hypothetical protein